MTDQSHDELHKLQRIVKKKSEDRLAEQRVVIGLMECDDQHEAAQRARRTLAIMESVVDRTRARLLRAQCRSMY
jgi:hypothetical protein